ncbi:alpha/beta hydrolase [Mycobacterium sp. BMJ-28]
MTANPHGVALDPAAAAFVAAADSQRNTNDRRPPEARQAVFADVQRGLADMSGAEVTERRVTIDIPDHGPLPIHLVEPAVAERPLPAMLYLLGGGWGGGGGSTHDGIVGELATRAGVAVVLPEYGRAPEAGYPVPVEQAYATALWIAENGAEHGLDPTRLAVGGDSEGATLAIAVVLMSLQRNGPGFRQLVAFTPVTDADFATPSYLMYGEGYGLRRDEMQSRWDQYAADPTLRDVDTVCPLRADDGDLARFPPALVITAEADVVRDEGEAFAARLRSSGAVCAAVRYEGMIHDFVTLAALKNTSAARAARAQAASVLRAALTDPRAGEDVSRVRM